MGIYRGKEKMIFRSLLIFFLAGGNFAFAASIDTNNQKGAASSAFGKEKARAQVKLLKTWSERKDSRPSANEISEVNVAQEELKNNPKITGPLLLEAFLNKSHGRDFRKNCAELIRQAKFSIPKEFTDSLKSAVHDDAEDARLRIYAAQFLLRDKRPNSSTKRAVLNMAEEFLESGIEEANVRLGIMPKFVGNSRATKIMLAELKRGDEVGPTLWTLGKLKGSAAIRPITQLLNSGFKNRKFPKTRAYLALGEIGGRRPYNLLLKYLERETNTTKRNIIVRAIGLSRDPRAKGFLLSKLESPNEITLGSILRGLQYLGDKSVVPELEDQLKRPLSAHDKFLIQRAINAINQGKIEPEW